MIVFEKVSKQFPTGDTVLDEVSFRIRPQDFVVIHGPSGSGKTTLLRLIYKDLEPSAGIITIDGQNIAKLKNRHIPDLRRKIGFAFQDFKVIPDRNVWENVSLMLEILNFKKPVIKDRLDHLLELVGLQHKAGLFPRQLSGGEIQRVTIARAIAAEPSILLADEPTGNLDPETSKSIVDLLKQINQLGTTVIMASHDIQAYSGGNLHELHLENGRITQDTHPVDKDDKVEKPTQEDAKEGTTKEEKTAEDKDKPHKKTKHHLKPEEESAEKPAADHQSEKDL